MLGVYKSNSSLCSPDPLKVCVGVCVCRDPALCACIFLICCVWDISGHQLLAFTLPLPLVLALALIPQPLLHRGNQKSQIFPKVVRYTALESQPYVGIFCCRWYIGLCSGNCGQGARASGVAVASKRGNRQILLILHLKSNFCPDSYIIMSLKTIFPL